MVVLSLLRWTHRHPAYFGGGVMTLWILVTYGFGSLDLPILQPGWFPHLGVVITNLLGAAAVLLVGWRCGVLGRSALRSGATRRWVWITPLVAVDVSYLLLGRGEVPGLTGSVGYLVSSAAGMAAVGASEELAGRGVGLAAANPDRALPTVLVVSAVFGIGHLGNYLLYSADLQDTLWQILTAAVSGLCWSAGRLWLGSIWPLAFVHGLSDWTQLNSPGAAPFWYQVTVMLLELGYGAATLAVLHRARGA